MTKSYYALVYETVDDYAARRQPFRQAHLALVTAAHARGEVVMGGALGDPPDGALLVFRADSAAPVEAFAASDPYVLNGLVTRWRVRQWNVVIGGQA